LIIPVIVFKIAPKLSPPYLEYPMLNPHDQRHRATQRANEGIHDLLAAGIAPARVAEAYATATVQLLLAHAGREAAQDLLTSLFMMVDWEEEPPPWPCPPLKPRQNFLYISGE
jgi:hypothetical protein